MSMIIYLFSGFFSIIRGWRVLLVSLSPKYWEVGGDDGPGRGIHVGNGLGKHVHLANASRSGFDSLHRMVDMSTDLPREQREPLLGEISLLGSILAALRRKGVYRHKGGRNETLNFSSLLSRSSFGGLPYRPC